MMKNVLHKFIAWYLRRCGGDAHCYPYGEQGRYLVIMDEDTYHRFTVLAKDRTPKEFHNMICALREVGADVCPEWADGKHVFIPSKLGSFCASCGTRRQSVQSDLALTCQACTEKPATVHYCNDCYFGNEP